MKTTWLLRLFPQAWRDRYEEEFRALLEERPASVGDLVDITAAAGDAQIRYRQLPAGALAAGGGSGSAPQPARRSAERRVRWMMGFYANALLFLIVNLALFGINLVTTPGEWWAIFPLWGWAMFLTLHAATLVRGRALLATHLALFAILNSGLAWINLSTGGDLWFQWPLAATATLLIGHALLAYGVTGYLGVHVIVYGLAMAQLGATAWVYPDAREGALSAGMSWGIVLLAHALSRFSRISLLSLHTLVFLGVGAQLLVQDLLGDDDLWFYYQLLGWGVVLAAHFAVSRGLVPWFGDEWEQRKRDELTRLARLEAGPAEDAPDGGHSPDLIAARVRELRLLHLHAFAFSVGLGVGVVLNLLTLSVGPWVLWPLWPWSALLAVHAAYVLSRRSLIGAHLVLFVTLNAGLIAIDVIYSGANWFYWPLGGTAILFLLHLAFDRDTLRAIRDWESRRVAAMME